MRNLTKTQNFSQNKNRDFLQCGYYQFGKPVYEVHRDLLATFSSAYKLCNKRADADDLIKKVKKFHEGLTNYRKKVGVVHHRVRKT